MMNQTKKLVIVGGSYAGFTLAEYFWSMPTDFKVMIIEKKDHFEYVASTIKSLVDKDWPKKNTLSYKDITKAYEKRFEVIRGTLV